MGWIAHNVATWGTRKQQQESDHWLDLAQAMTGSELGTLMAMATHMRHGIRDGHGVDLLDPALVDMQHPAFVMELHRLIKGFQAAKQQSDAAAVMVWMFSLRAGSNLELRQRGRALWRELARGFPHVEYEAEALSMLAGRPIRIEGFDRVPLGLEPLP